MSESLEPTQRPKTRIGKQYVLVRLLACSELGETWVANDEIKQRSVVLKFLPLELYKQPRFRARVQQCVALVKPLVHQTINPIEQMCDNEKNGFFLVAPHIKSKNLNELLEISEKQKVSFANELILKILWQMACAVDFAHKYHVLHLGLKPNNIFVDQQEQVRITDFLLPSEIRESLQMLGHKPIISFEYDRYVSPEQLQGQRLTPKTDQFALSLLAYRLFNQRFPWSASDLLNWGNLILHEPVAVIDRANIQNGEQCDLDQLNGTFKQGLAISPLKRFFSCRQLVYQLKKSFPELALQTTEIELTDEALPDDLTYIAEVMQRKQRQRDVIKHRDSDQTEKLSHRSFFSFKTLGWAINFSLVVIILLMLFQRREQIQLWLFGESPRQSEQQQQKMLSNESIMPNEIITPNHHVSRPQNVSVVPITPVTIPKPATGVPVTTDSHNIDKPPANSKNTDSKGHL